MNYFYMKAAAAQEYLVEAKNNFDVVAQKMGVSRQELESLIADFGTSQVKRSKCSNPLTQLFKQSRP